MLQSVNPYCYSRLQGLRSWQHLFCLSPQAWTLHLTKSQLTFTEGLIKMQLTTSLCTTYCRCGVSFKGKGQWRKKGTAQKAPFHAGSSSALPVLLAGRWSGGVASRNKTGNILRVGSGGMGATMNFKLQKLTVQPWVTFPPHTHVGKSATCPPQRLPVTWAVI